MAQLSFDDVPNIGEAPVTPVKTAGMFDDVKPAKPTGMFDDVPAKMEGRMPGFFEAGAQGIGSAWTGLGQTATTIGGGTPEAVKETSPAAAPFEMRDLYQPIERGAPKIMHRLGSALPTLTTGVLGAAAGTGVGTLAAGPAGGVVGGLGGGVLGSAAGAALQTIGPVFAEELKKHPGNPDAAWDAAVKHASISAAASGASWAAFPLRFFQGPVKQLAFQALGVQPGIGVAEQAAKNVATDRPITENLGQAYVEGAVGTAVPAVGHGIVSGGLRGKPPATHQPPPTPDQLRLWGDAIVKHSQADSLEHLSTLPGVTPDQRAAYIRQSDQARRAAEYDNFQANMPLVPIKERGKTAQSWVDNFMPELQSERALAIEPKFAEYVSSKRQQHDAIFNRADAMSKEWYKMPFTDVREVIRSYELGTAPPAPLITKYPWLRTRLPEFQKWLKQAYIDEHRLGSKSAYYTDYFPHEWKDPAKARQTINGIIQSMGPRWFQKARHYDMIEAGLASGLELKNKNPEFMVASRLMAGVDMREKMNLINGLHEQGLAVPSELAPPALSNRRNPQPWMEVNAPNGTKWMLAPDIQPLWKNAVDAKGLWSNEGMAGSAFRNWMGLKSMWVPIKLGLSMFHPVHVAHISVSNNISRALNETFGRGQQSFGRRLAALPEAAAQSVMDLALALPIGTPYVGKNLRESWATTPDRQTAQQRADVRLMNEAGIAPQLPAPLKNKAKLEFREAMYNNEHLKAIWPGIQHAFHLANPTRWIFDQWIPNLKIAAVKREAEFMLRKDPTLINDADRRGVALRAIGKQVDNRFGEMFYGSLFWNRTIKDASIGSFLSLGWNLGFAREFIGGALEPAARRMIDAPTPTRQLIRDTTNKSTNAFVYTLTAMTINAIINKSMTGESPEGMDYIFPRIGGLNTDGSPRRISNPFYTREVPMAQKNIEERQSMVGGLAQMLYHKLMFAPFIEMGTNRDYFGRQIYDENAPGYKQVKQFVTHVVTEQLNPMSISGAKKALELSGKPHTTADVFKQITDPDVYAPLLGFGPAPAYASKSEIQNRIAYLFGKFSPSTKPYMESEVAKERSEARTAYLMAQQNKDQPAIHAAAKRLSELGVKGPNIVKLRPGGGIQYMFSRLPESQQIDLMKSMTKEEFREYYPKASRKSRGDKEIQLMSQFYYNR